MNFSLLLSTYANDSHVHLHAALQSVYDQTLKPAEYVVVKDGPVSKNIDDCLILWQDKIGNNFKVIAISKNVGLAKALNIGLKNCNFSYVARMDSDDICYDYRFSKQFEYIKNNPDISLLGGWYKQYDDQMVRVICDRKVPVAHDEIMKFARYRTPFNHVTAVMKLADILEVGGYPEDIDGRLEDWWLALRLINRGFILHNLPEYLVKVRGGDDFIGRRGGIKYLISEVSNLSSMKSEDLISGKVLFLNLICRTLVRLLPVRIRNFVYGVVRKINVMK